MLNFAAETEKQSVGQRKSDKEKLSNEQTISLFFFSPPSLPKKRNLQMFCVTSESTYNVACLSETKLHV